MTDPEPRDRETTKSPVNPPDSAGRSEPDPSGAQKIEVPELKEYERREEHERLRRLGIKRDGSSSPGQA